MAKRRRNTTTKRKAAITCPAAHYKARARLEHGAPSCSYSLLQLREAWVRDHGEDACHPLFESPPFQWSYEENREGLALALNAYQEAESFPDAKDELGRLSAHLKRVAMMTSLDGALNFLTLHLPVSDLSQLQPLRALLYGLRDLNNGLQPAALVPSPRKGSKHSQPAVDFKARCLIASEIMQIRGLDTNDADKMVIDRVRESAQRFGLRFGNVRRNLSDTKTMEHWRTALRRQQRQDFDPLTGDTLASRVASLRVQVRECARFAPSIQHVLENVLGPISSPVDGPAPDGSDQGS